MRLLDVNIRTAEQLSRIEIHYFRSSSMAAQIVSLLWTNKDGDWKVLDCYRRPISRTLWTRTSKVKDEATMSTALFLRKRNRKLQTFFIGTQWRRGSGKDSGPDQTRIDEKVSNYHIDQIVKKITQSGPWTLMQEVMMNGNGHRLYRVIISCSWEHFGRPFFFDRNKEPVCVSAGNMAIKRRNWVPLVAIRWKTATDRARTTRTSARCRRRCRRPRWDRWTPSSARSASSSASTWRCCRWPSSTSASSSASSAASTALRCVRNEPLQLTNRVLTSWHQVGATLRLADSKSLVGLSGIFIGVGEITGGALFGILGSRTNKYGRDPIILLGFLTQATGFFLIFLNVPDAAPLGDTFDGAFIDSRWEVAFSLSISYQGLAICVPFAYGSQRLQRRRHGRIRNWFQLKKINAHKRVESLCIHWNSLSTFKG